MNLNQVMRNEYMDSALFMECSKRLATDGMRKRHFDQAAEDKKIVDVRTAYQLIANRTD